MKIQKSREQYFVTLPKKIIEAIEWNKGDKINVIFDGKNAIKLVKI